MQSHALLLMIMLFMIMAGGIELGGEAVMNKADLLTCNGCHVKCCLLTYDIALHS